ncbi:hypothetical protein MLD38_037075 [Melastoma candidum]|uniref:Uncharacterized protein n=1 Tax=Melastoma candidum TaxID=119954 RepID=A0ACB9LLJ1_9MYRT|nr:hypothetical protein MLD38_037075 [Melastoma candidum]
MYRLVNTTSPGVRNISRLTELFEEGHNNYQQFHRRGVNPLELTWPRSWVMTEPGSSFRPISAANIRQRGNEITLMLGEPSRVNERADRHLPMLSERGDRQLPVRMPILREPRNHSFSVVSSRASDVGEDVIVSRLEVASAPPLVEEVSRRSVDSRTPSQHTGRIIGYRHVSLLVYEDPVDQPREESIRMLRVTNPVSSLSEIPEVCEVIEQIAKQRSMEIDDIWRMIEPSREVTRHKSFSVQKEELSTYVALTFKFPGYYEYSLDTLIDTGCSISCARLNALPDEWWEPLQKSIHMVNVDGMATIVSHRALNVSVFIGGQKFIIKEILAHPLLEADIILGNAFLKGQRENLPFVQDADDITIGCVKISILPDPKLRLKFGFYLIKRTEYCGDSPCERAFRVRARRGDTRIMSMNGCRLVEQEHDWMQTLFSPTSTSSSGWYDDLFVNIKQEVCMTVKLTGTKWDKFLMKLADNFSNDPLKLWTRNGLKAD